MSTPHIRTHEGYPGIFGQFISAFPHRVSTAPGWLVSHVHVHSNVLPGTLSSDESMNVWQLSGRQHCGQGSPTTPPKLIDPDNNLV